MDLGAVEIEAAEILLETRLGLEGRRSGNVVDRAAGFAPPVEQRGRAFQYLDALEVCHVGRPLECKGRKGSGRLAGAEAVLEKRVLREAAHAVGLAGTGAGESALHAAHVLHRFLRIENCAILDQALRHDVDRPWSVQDGLGQARRRARDAGRVARIARRLALNGDGVENNKSGLGTSFRRLLLGKLGSVSERQATMLGE